VDHPTGPRILRLETRGTGRGRRNECRPSFLRTGRRILRLETRGTGRGRRNECRPSFQRTCDRKNEGFTPISGRFSTWPVQKAVSTQFTFFGYCTKPCETVICSSIYVLSLHCSYRFILQQKEILERKLPEALKLSIAKQIENNLFTKVRPHSQQQLNF
jgi:hypothetical protein